MSLKDPVAKAVYMKQYRKDHREEIKSYNKQYNNDNSELRKKQRLNWYYNNKERAQKKHMEWKVNNTEKIKEYNKEQWKLYHEKFRQYKKDHPEIHLKSSIKTLTRYAIPFNVTYIAYTAALMAWSRVIRKRDGYKCTWCNSEKNLRSHHIWHRNWCPESSLDVDNGITLCHDCHMEQHRLDRS